MEFFRGQLVHLDGEGWRYVVLEPVSQQYGMDFVLVVPVYSFERGRYNEDYLARHLQLTPIVQNGKFLRVRVPYHAAPY